MSERIYPWGYGAEMIDSATLWVRLSKAHPEFRRRLFALIVAGNGRIGVGNLWRSSLQQAKNYASDPKRFAPAGASFHETQTFASGVSGCNAADMVGGDLDNDGTRESVEHRAAWAFLADNAARFGLVEFSNVNSEPWHTQCADIPNSVREWKRAGSPDPNPNFVLPGGPPTHEPDPPSAPAPPPPPAPAPTGKKITVNVSLSTLKFESGPEPAVKMLQTLLNLKAGQGLKVDGSFGAATYQSVKNWQTVLGLTADGVVGPKTWKSLIES